MKKPGFEEICAPYSALVYRHCLQMLQNAADAEDAAQEAMLRAYRSFDQFDGKTPGGWLYRIAHNVCLDVLRSGRKKRETTDLDTLRQEGFEPADPGPAPDEVYERTSRQQALHLAIGKLPTDQQVLLMLFYSEHLSYEEIAQREGLRLGTVKSRLNRAKDALRKLLPDE